MRTKNFIVKTNNIITQKQLENGIWQFMIDHSVPYEKNVYKVNFGISTKEDLMRRIYARAGFIYKIKDAEKQQEELERKIKFYHNLILTKEYADAKNRKYQRLKIISPFKYKILSIIVHLRNYLFNKWCK